MVTSALAQFLGGLAELSETTGVGIHAPEDAPLALDADGRRYAFHATCQDDGTFAYAVSLAPVISLDSRRTA